jgi:hypothetical protein
LSGLGGGATVDPGQRGAEGSALLVDGDHGRSLAGDRDGDDGLARYDDVAQRGAGRLPPGFGVLFGAEPGQPGRVADGAFAQQSGLLVDGDGLEAGRSDVDSDGGQLDSRRWTALFSHWMRDLSVTLTPCRAVLKPRFGSRGAPERNIVDTLPADSPKFFSFPLANFPHVV